jgi:hypothetical protein
VPAQHHENCKAPSADFQDRQRKVNGYVKRHLKRPRPDTAASIEAIATAVALDKSLVAIPFLSFPGIVPLVSHFVSTSDRSKQR